VRILDIKNDMTRDECYDAIMGLQGAEAFKRLAARLHTLTENKAARSIDMPVPNLLWIAGRGAGVSTCLTLFAEYLAATQIITFRGDVKSFEYKLKYTAPHMPFFELDRLHTAISENAGHRSDYCGLICIDINDWKKHVNEVHFLKFLDYIANAGGKILTIFCVNTDDESVIESVEAALASCVRVETLRIQMPEAGELVTLAEDKYMVPNGFRFTKNARKLLAAI
jgi:hypothetical protein